MPDVNFWDLRGAFNPDTDVLVKKKKEERGGQKRRGHRHKERLWEDRSDSGVVCPQAKDDSSASGWRK